MIRKKTHLETTADRSLDTMEMKEVRDLVGFYEPEVKGKKIESWEINTTEEGSGYSAKSQFEAEVIGSLEEIKVLLLKLVNKKE